MMEDIIDFIFGCLVGTLGWFFGGINGLIKVLITFTVIDYISGIIAAYIRRELSSKKGFDGIMRKIQMFALVGIAHVIDKNLLGNTEALKTAVCLFYVGNEGISIVENAVKSGLKVPEALQEKLQKFTYKNEKHDNKPVA